MWTLTLFPLKRWMQKESSKMYFCYFKGYLKNNNNKQPVELQCCITVFANNLLKESIAVYMDFFIPAKYIQPWCLHFSLTDMTLKHCCVKRKSANLEEIIRLVTRAFQASIFKELSSNSFLSLHYLVLWKKLCMNARGIFSVIWHFYMLHKETKSITAWKVKIYLQEGLQSYYPFFPNCIFKIHDLLTVIQLLRAVKCYHLLHRNPITVTTLVNFPTTYSLSFWSKDSLVAQRLGLKLTLAAVSEFESSFEKSIFFII